MTVCPAHVVLAGWLDVVGIEPLFNGIEVSGGAGSYVGMARKVKSRILVLHMSLMCGIRRLL